MAKVIIVTGSNKGIGFAVVKTLLKRRAGIVYLTARDDTRGKHVVDKLKNEGLNPEFHQLDVTHKESVKAFAEFLKKNHGGIDIIINNAAVATASYQETTYKDAKRVIETNYESILTVQEHLFPLLNNNGRVINISSDLGHISNLENKYWIERLTKTDLKQDDVNTFVEWFLNSVKNGTMNKDDFEATELLAYKVSKIALSALTRVQQKEIGKNISINSVHPGFVQTDMTKNLGLLTADESSEAVVHLALDVDQSVKGKYYWYDKTEKIWDDHNLKLHGNREEVQKYLRAVNFDFKSI